MHLHRNIKTIGLAAAATLAVAAPASAATVPVQSLSGPFEASNSTVTKTPDGVHFGTYADGGAIGGSLIYNGANGSAVSALSNFGYTFTYRQAGDTTGAAPYARVFVDSDPAVDSDADGNPGNDVDHDILLDPSNCGAVLPAQATDLSLDMATSPVRLDDDAGNDCGSSTMTFAAAKAALPAGSTVSALLVSQGFSTGQDVSALLRNIRVNADVFAFNVPPAAGAPGAVGAPGVTQIVTRTITVPAGVAPVTQSCTGNVVRTLRAPSRKGERFLRVAAALKTPTGFRSLKTSGRVVTLDLTGKPEGNYNVRLISRYRTAGGKVRRVVSTRNLSVACA